MDNGSTGGLALEFIDLVRASRAVAATRKRLEKIEILALFLRRLRPEEVRVAVAYLSGELRQKRTGVGPSAVRDALAAAPAPAPSLALIDVDRRLDALAAASGRGSAGERGRLLGELMAAATREEQELLEALLVGEVRQGALSGLMAEAIARAAEVPADEVRRALMLSGDLGEAASAALRDGRPGLARFGLVLFRPVQPMLAQTADGVGDALTRLGRAALEHKLDGARVQVHRAGDDVRVFTRGLNEVTAAVPEVVEIARALPLRDAILDGEALALRADGTPQAFQTTMRRFGRRLDVAGMREELPLRGFFFDLLYLDGESLLETPGAERARALASVTTEALRVPRIETESADEAERYLQAAIDAGHEGVMAKSLDQGYEAGSRGRGWLKVKPAHTLDLVVLAVEWGSGRRRSWLSNLHLGARDPDGGWVMLGKTFKGMTDEMLAWQTRRLLELEQRRDEHVVWVRPELVVEIAFDGVQASPHYPGGLALRFARVKRYREDRLASSADTIGTVRAIHDRALAAGARTERADGET